MLTFRYGKSVVGSGPSRRGPRAATGGPPGTRRIGSPCDGPGVGHPRVERLLRSADGRARVQGTGKRGEHHHGLVVPRWAREDVVSQPVALVAFVAEA